MNAHRQHGFTLWELLMTLLIAGILIGIGVPNVMEFQRNGGMTAAANQLVTGVLMARTEAVKRQVPVTLCLTDDATVATPVCANGAIANSASRGFIVFVDENGDTLPDGAPDLTDATDGNAAVNNGELVLMRSVAPGGTIRLSANCGYVQYMPNGFTRGIVGLCNPNPRAILYCDDRGRRVAAGSMSAARVVRIDSTGRGQVLQEVEAVTNTITGPLAAVTPTCP